MGILWLASLYAFSTMVVDEFETEGQSLVTSDVELFKGEHVKLFTEIVMPQVEELYSIALSSSEYSIVQLKHLLDDIFHDSFAKFLTTNIMPHSGKLLSHMTTGRCNGNRLAQQIMDIKPLDAQLSGAFSNFYQRFDKVKARYGKFNACDVISSSTEVLQVAQSLYYLDTEIRLLKSLAASLCFITPKLYQDLSNITLRVRSFFSDRQPADLGVHKSPFDSYLRLFSEYIAFFTRIYTLSLLCFKRNATFYGKYSEITYQKVVALQSFLTHLATVDSTSMFSRICNTTLAYWTDIETTFFEYGLVEFNVRLKKFYISARRLLPSYTNYSDSASAKVEQVSSYRDIMLILNAWLAKIPGTDNSVFARDLVQLHGFLLDLFSKLPNYEGKIFKFDEVSLKNAKPLLDQRMTPVNFQSFLLQTLVSPIRTFLFNCNRTFKCFKPFNRVINTFRSFIQQFKDVVEDITRPDFQSYTLGQTIAAFIEKTESSLHAVGITNFSSDSLSLQLSSVLYKAHYAGVEGFIAPKALCLLVNRLLTASIEVKCCSIGANIVGDSLILFLALFFDKLQIDFGAFFDNVNRCYYANMCNLGDDSNIPENELLKIDLLHSESMLRYFDLCSIFLTPLASEFSSIFEHDAQLLEHSDFLGRFPTYLAKIRYYLETFVDCGLAAEVLESSIKDFGMRLFHREAKFARQLAAFLQHAFVAKFLELRGISFQHSAKISFDVILKRIVDASKASKSTFPQMKSLKSHLFRVLSCGLVKAPQAAPLKVICLILLHIERIINCANSKFPRIEASTEAFLFPNISMPNTLTLLDSLVDPKTTHSKELALPRATAADVILHLTFIDLFLRSLFAPSVPTELPSYEFLSLDRLNTLLISKQNFLKLIILNPFFTC